jgi:hypothetical protein
VKVEAKREEPKEEVVETKVEEENVPDWLK